LHAEDSTEGPFAVELNNWVDHGRVTRDSAVGNDMLAGVVTFRWAGP
jgi:hypothetical protein